MSIFWKEYKEYCVTITIALFGIILVWFAILPLHKHIKDQMNRSQELLTDNEIRNELVAKLSDLREKKDLVTKSENRLNVVISKSNIVDLVKMIEDTAKETNNTITIDEKLQPAAVTPIKKPATDTSAGDANKSLANSLPSDHRLGIAIKLVGSYDSIAQFIQKLESMPYETDVTAVSLSVQEPIISSNQTSVDIFSSNTGTPAKTPLAQDNTPLLLQATLDTTVYISED
jgi:Tfp pilus assembly protein PilO